MIKTPSGKKSWEIELKPVPKIIERVKETDPDIFLVGFKAEYDVSDEELVDRASRRMGETGMDLVVANDVAREKVGFGTDANEVFIVDRDGEVTHQQKSKREIAEILLTIVGEKMDERGTNKS
jgi:phosphopantothenoylcysteine decarboxylase/phosphopantothenate--cysteine ligase